MHNSLNLEELNPNTKASLLNSVTSIQTTYYFSANQLKFFVCFIDLLIDDHFQSGSEKIKNFRYKDLNDLEILENLVQRCANACFLDPKTMDKLIVNAVHSKRFESLQETVRGSKYQKKLKDIFGFFCDITENTSPTYRKYAEFIMSDEEILCPLVQEIHRNIDAKNSKSSSSVPYQFSPNIFIFLASLLISEPLFQALSLKIHPDAFVMIITQNCHEIPQALIKLLNSLLKRDNFFEN